MNVMDFIQTKAGGSFDGMTQPTSPVPGTTSIANAPPPTTFGPGAMPPSSNPKPAYGHAVSTSPPLNPQAPEALQPASYSGHGAFQMRVEDSGRPAGAPAVTASAAPVVSVPAPAAPVSVATTREDKALEESIFGKSTAPTPSPASIYGRPAPATVPGAAVPTGVTPVVVDEDDDFIADFGVDDDVLPEGDDFDTTEDDGPVFGGPPQQTQQTQQVQQPQPTPAVQQAPATVAAPPLSIAFPEAAKGLFDKLAGESDLGDAAVVLKQLETDLESVRFHVGTAILQDPTSYKPSVGNKVHEVLWNVKWNAEAMLRMSPHKLCEFEVILTGHQAWVRGLENEWAARHRLLGRELERRAFKRRDGYSGSTVAAKEQKMFEAEAAMQTVRMEYMRAWGMHSLLDGMGDTFKQLEDGIKRTIDFVKGEYLRQK
jgi:hypothetical protein